MELYPNGSYSPSSTGLTSATITFTATRGTYDFRFFSDDSYTLLDTSPTFTVT